MSPQEFFLLVVSILASVSGQFFLKAGALKLGKVSASNLLGHLFGILVTPELLAGLTCYAMGAVAYIFLLTRVKLSIAAPSVALSYVFAVMLGYFLFRESIPVSRLIGLGLIVSGVVLVAWKN